MSISRAFYNTARANNYVTQYNNAVVTPRFANTLKNQVAIAVKNMQTYKIISHFTKVPWQFVASLHMRESTLDFNKHLHEGSPLTGRTINVPKGYPKAPPQNGRRYTFIESAIDALVTLKKLNQWKDWSISGMLYVAELYNGAGYIKNGWVSPYVWSGTQFHTKGKYVADGKYNANAIDQQLGVAIFLKELLKYA